MIQPCAALPDYTCRFIFSLLLPLRALDTLHLVGTDRAIKAVHGAFDDCRLYQRENEGNVPVNSATALKANRRDTDTCEHTDVKPLAQALA
eukprot:1825489-Pleurochrysis_carterae.AAC.22